VGLLTEQERQRDLVFENDEYQDDCYNDEYQVESGIVVPDELDELQALTDEERRTKFQAHTGKKWRDNDNFLLWKRNNEEVPMA
jgi:hypothetical protein